MMEEDIGMDAGSNLEKCQDKVTDEKLSRKTFIKNAGGLSIHQTANIQEAISTMERSLQEAIQVFKQTMQIKDTSLDSDDAAIQ
jgi:secreted PhoX family phosphatase